MRLFLSLHLFTGDREDRLFAPFVHVFPMKLGAIPAAQCAMAQSASVFAKSRTS